MRMQCCRDEWQRRTSGQLDTRSPREGPLARVERFSGDGPYHVCSPPAPSVDQRSNRLSCPSMADSDVDEYDRSRRRDKFARERRDYQDAGRRRDDWSDGNNRGWGDRSRPSRDAYGRDYRRDRYSPDLSPPSKRMRSREWDNTSPRGTSDWDSRSTDSCPTQPPMDSFKKFLSRLDDEVRETDAVEMYNEYKLDFRRAQIKEFFEKHKDEEWFKVKYHPEEKPKRDAEQQAAVNKRLEVFNKLMEGGLIDSTSIDVENSDKITRILNSAVIYLEGGTDFDLQILDQKEDEEPKKDKIEMSLFAVDATTQEGNDSTAKQDSDTPATSNQVSNDTTNDASHDEEMPEDKVKVENESPNKSSEDQAKEDEQEESAAKEATDEVMSDAPTSNGENSAKNTSQSEASPSPRALHRTASIFLRNLPPNVTRAEVLEVCRKFNGFLRLSIADPQADRKFNRRGWATFSKDVQIKDICWQFNKHKFGGIECGAIINRELSRRIRSVNGIASHRSVVRADIRHAAKIVYNMDRAKGLWQPNTEDTTDGQEQEKPQFSDSRNPLLHNITDYLIEEADAEEEELLGSESESTSAEVGQALERDEQLLRVLDRMLLYLRIVHSLDYYNHTDYPQEDEMPNRIGIMHARGSPPSSKVTLKEVNEYMKTFEEKIRPFLEPIVPLSEEEAEQLGLMCEEEAVKKFIADNTKCTKPGKYECAIESKKFKGPEFVLKHIHNKHQNLIEEVKKDCLCFNNYLMDGKRPSLPEHPSNRSQQSGASSKDSMSSMSPHNAPAWGGNPAAVPYPPPYAYAGYGPPRGPPGAPFIPMPWPMGARGVYPPMPPAGYGMSMPPGRVLRSYRDLDAPNDW